MAMTTHQMLVFRWPVIFFASPRVRWQLAGLHGMGSQRLGHADRRALEAAAAGGGEERRFGHAWEGDGRLGVGWKFLGKAKNHHRKMVV